MKNKLITKKAFSKLFYLAMTLFMAFAFHIVAQPYIIGYQDGVHKPNHTAKKDSINQTPSSNQSQNTLSKKVIHRPVTYPKQTVHDSAQRK
ncbi:MAG TPA: hypothetical protein VK806_00360 [Bacteroidia bacterium]|jgi:hypothetical protein|nr:hypothetical protein [Bacteroidia bacterium]